MKSRLFRLSVHFYTLLLATLLSGYHPKAFTISPPRIDRVIEKRLNFALKLTSGEIPIESIGSGVQVHLENLGQLIKAFLHTISRNEDIGECIDNIAGGNVRMALDLVRGFFGSGHVDTQKIVQIHERNRYIIPQHEFLRAVIYGDAEHYDHEQSPIANLFDISRRDAKEHFLLPLVIGVLASSSGSNVEEGFVDTSTIYERLQGLGFTPEQIDYAITRGHKKKLLETSARRIPQPGLEMPQALRVTTVGLYHIARLCRFFTYVDAMIVDTPILDAAVRESIRNERYIAGRVSRIDIFRRYLDEQWQILKDTPAAFAFDWSNVSNDLKADTEYVRSRINS